MSLSRQSVTALIDLIENKLSCMAVVDRDDLREKVALQRAMFELSSTLGLGDQDSDGVSFGAIPRRGRRRRFAGDESYV
jgi:hypothetical protein